MADFRRLKIWVAAQDLTDAIYRSTVTFPSDERYGLTSQMRRAADSIGANIAEGCGRLGDRELARFLRIAAGSAAGLESHIIQSQRLSFLKAEDADRLLKGAVLLRRRLYQLHNYLSGTRSTSKKLD